MERFRKDSIFDSSSSSGRARICRPILARATSPSRGESSRWERSEREAVWVEVDGIWSSREEVEASCGSSGARGALRCADELAEDAEATRETRLMLGIEVRL